MATITAVDVNTLAVEGVKYNATGITSEIYSAATTTTLASGDTIVGPSIPAGTFVTDVVVAWTDVDSATSFTWECGYAGTLAAFVATGNTTGQANGIQHANVAGALGYSPAADTPCSMRSITSMIGAAIPTWP